MRNIPIFFFASEADIPGLAIALNSIRDNVSKRYKCLIHILFYELSKESVLRLIALEGRNFTLKFAPVNSPADMDSLSLCFLVSRLFPAYDKCIFLHPDVVVSGDISELWEEPLGWRTVGAVGGKTDSGVLLVNLKRLRDADSSPILSDIDILYLDPCWYSDPEDSDSLVTESQIIRYRPSLRMLFLDFLPRYAMLP